MKLPLKSRPCLTWPAKPHSKIMTPLPFCSKTSGSVTLPGSPCHPCPSPQQIGKTHTSLTKGGEGEMFREGSSAHPVDLNFELQLQDLSSM